MIAHLRGIIEKLEPGHVTVDSAGVGYHVFVPLDVWDRLKEGTEAELKISSYIREDAFDLYGFLDRGTKMLFEKCIAMSGVGPKLGLELCAVPRSMIMQAIGTQDPSLLTSIKGIGKKTAEKLLLDLKSLAEKQPEMFGDAIAEKGSAQFDQDAVDALKNLGYDTQTVLQVISNLPDDMKTTEERVEAALRSL